MREGGGGSKREGGDREREGGRQKDRARTYREEYRSR